MPVSDDISDTANVWGAMSMRQILILATLTAISSVGAQGIAQESLSPGHSRSGVDKMFLDAHMPDIPPRYSRAEVKHMIRDAKTSENFERLADYFDYKALDYKRKAQEELTELERLAAVRFRPRTYSMQFATTFDLIQRYKAKGHECSERAEVYRELASANNETE